MNDDVDIRVRLRGARQARRDADHVSGGMDRMGGSGSRLRGVLGGLAGSARGLAGPFRGLAASARGLSGPLRSIGEASRTAGFALGTFGVAAGGYLARLGTQFNATLDSQRVAFTTYMRSGEKAAKFMGQLQDLALESPVLDPKTTGEGARMLMAYGVATKDVLPLVKALGDMSAASGKTIEEVLPNAALAIGQIASKGKLQTEELNQLAESVGLSRGRIRKALGMTQDDFEMSFTPGNSISADKALPAIRKAMVAQSKGAAELLAGTTAGKMDRLKEVASRGMGALTRGLYDGVGNLAGGLADRIGEVDFEKVAKDAGQLLGKGFERAKAAWSGFVGVIKPALPFLQNVLWPLLKGIGKGIAVSIAGAVKVALPVVRVFFQALGWIGTKLAPLKGVFEAVGGAIGFLVGGPILKAIGALGKFGGVFRIIGSAARILAVPIRAVGTAAGFVGRMLGNALKRIATAPGAVLSGLRSGLTRVLDAVTGFGKRFLGAGKGIGKSLIDGVKGALGSLAGFGKSIYNAIASSINNTLPDKIKIPGPVPDIPLPANPLPLLASGGTITSAGSVIVGEAGPEVLSLSKGARVDPLPKHGPMTPVLAGMRDPTIRVPVVLDGRVVAEAVGRHVTRAKNRR